MNKDIIGRQGLAIDKDYYYVSGSKTLAKYDKEWNLVLLNDNPFSQGYPANPPNHRRWHL